MSLQVKVPTVGESITEATIAEWSKQDGDFVNRDDVLLVLETDKASVDVVAEAAGVLKINVAEGETVEMGAVIGEIDTNAEASPAAAETEKAPTAPPPPAEASALSKQNVHPDLKNHLSPAVSKIVAEKGMDPSTLSGTGKGGRLTKADVQKAPAKAAAAPSSPKKETKIPNLPVVNATAVEEETRKPMSRLRQTIAKRLVEAQQTAAILTTFNEIDMSNLFRLRDEYKDQFEKRHGIRLGFMGFFVKACIEALKEFPAVNAFIDGKDLVYHNYYNVGIAVGTPKGLVVPVIRNADQMSLAQIETAIRHYALKARENKITLDDLNGGTFTVSNGGVFGSLMSTPILNPPQSGILGMHKVEDRPVVVDGKVVVRPMMYVALSYDHRVIDGAESVQFLVRVKECIEDPSRMLMQV